MAATRSIAATSMSTAGASSSTISTSGICWVENNIFCKGSVDTITLGVDTMVQNKGRNVKKSPSQVDTSPEQVDTRSSQVDTRWLSQKDCFTVWDSKSTPNDLRSTLETSPRELFCQSGTVCRHTSWAGRHTLESL
ncbi:hypothetical protein Taro_024332 [Colocasia esculenta]|uniref:Uncharacterized protein n=1 Tax=Colocasia esculenta TaxID=4460 RepID=A0A843VK20_COLES|nr:hypothetical protein [Colocasia esculenta]